MTALVTERGRLGSATFSEDGLYRYDLTRMWPRPLTSAEPFTAVWIGLNPSTATADEDDPTIRRCIAFSKAWGASSYVMLNLFAFRATDPKDMKRAADPVGPLNDERILWWITNELTGVVVCAWGAHGEFQKRADDVVALLRMNMRGIPACLGKTKDGHPKHPLYLAKATQPVPMWEE